MHWDPEHDNIGHIGISLGGGQKISSYGFASNDYPIQEHPYTTFANYIGWAMPN